MANVPLRAYIREIENLIDRGQTEEAIAHCKHILQVYPKHIETYRMLGKAYLESQRYPEAADILQRVLSCLPDDFVSQVGMSIIREDEGNLDAAIAHMERAYEVQPSNNAVQEELRRLYGRRDGVEPSRVRLTRGSLARMYARGDLYHQAISEIKNALREDPQRPDLQVLLARMYYQSGQKFDAVEICNQLIEKYPYCFEANQVLSEILPNTNRADQAEIFKSKLIELDPYIAHITNEFTLPSDIPDASVTLEKLEWEPSAVNRDITPIWTSKAFTAEGSDSDSHRLPDWLESFSPETGDIKPRAEPPGKAQPEPESGSLEQILANPPEGESPPPAREESATPLEKIPEWMKSAGWTDTTSTSEAPSVSDLNNERQEAVASDNIPEWLKSLAPDTTSQPFADSEPHPDELSWLSAISSEQGKAAGETGQPVPPNDFIQGLPDWLNPEIENQPVNDLPEIGENLLAEAEETIPSWGQKAEQPEQAIEQNLPEPPEAAKTIIAGVPSGESPSLTQSPPTVDRSEPGTDLDGDETAAWLENIATRHSAEAETVLARPQDRLTNPPEWIKQEGSNEEQEIPEPEGANLIGEDVTDDQTPVDEAPFPSQIKSEWVPESFEDTPPAKVVATEPTIIEAPESQEMVSEIEPDLSLIPEAMEESMSEAPSEIAEITPSEELPDWLKALENQVTIDHEPVASEETHNEPVKIPAMPEWAQAPSTDWEIEPETPSEIAPGDLDKILQPEGSPAEGMPNQSYEEKAELTPQDGFGGVDEIKSSPPQEASFAAPPDSTQEEGSLYKAQMEMLDGQIDAAIEAYGKVIASGEFLDEVIRDLRDALYRYPINVTIWQALGDAYIRANRVQEALDAYTKAEELIR